MITEIHKIIVTEPVNLKLYSGIIPHKESSGAVFVYDMSTNDKKLDNSTREEIEKKLKNSFNYDYNGILVWIPKKHQENFISLVENYMVEKYNCNELDFSQSSMSEAIIFHNLNEGILAELVYASRDKDTFIDGIYNRGIFNNLLNDFYEQEDIWEDEKDTLDLTKAFSYRNNHIVSFLQVRDNTNSEQAKFYDLINMIKT